MDLRRFRKANNLSQGAIAAYLGVGQSFISQVERGVSQLSDTHQEKLLSNPEWVVPSGIFDKHSDEYTPKKDQDTEGMLPLIPIEAFAGPGVPAYEDEFVEDYYMVPEFKHSDFMLRVKGDSMTPKLCGGDLIACKQVRLDEVFFFQWGRCYVLLTRSQGCMVKRVHPSDKEGWIKCVSDNEKYAPFDVPLTDVVSLALVSGSISVE